MASGSVFHEVDSMLEVSDLIYDLATLNNWDDSIGEGKIIDPDFLKSLPRKSSEVLEWFKSNYDILKEVNEKEQKFNLEFDKEALDRIVNRDRVDQSEDATIEVLDDQFAFKGEDGEIVYGITRNPDQKRVTVTFRGSIAAKDWTQNWKYQGEKVKISAQDWDSLQIPKPNQELIQTVEDVEIHFGFYEYLFATEQKQEDRSTKFVEIMKHISEMLTAPENKGFSVYFTGHSLGAALATLAAAATSLSDEIEKPVRIITFAFPQVGKYTFFEAFQKLEETGRIQHLRVTNGNDAVPQGLAYLGYEHTGVHLNLFVTSWWSSRTHEITKTEVGWFSRWRNNMNMSFLFHGVTAQHKLTEHRRRLLTAKDDLEKQTLDDLYNDVEIRGF